ncbi:MAG: hypothetical protein AAF243_09745, partial [Cyanobacteria bacterium P01_A01_bin.137]
LYCEDKYTSTLQLCIPQKPAPLRCVAEPPLQVISAQLKNFVAARKILNHPTNLQIRNQGYH